MIQPASELSVAQLTAQPVTQTTEVVKEADSNLTGS